VRNHLQAVAELIQSGFTDGIHVYDTQADKPDYDPANWAGPWSEADKIAWALPARYVVIGASPTLRQVALSISRGRLDVDDRILIKGCGLSVASCRWVMENVRAVADRGRPSVEDYSTLLTFQESDELLDIDRDVDPPVAHATDAYRYRATPA
jgi:hypothetical protein